MFEPVCYPRNVPLIMNGEKAGDTLPPFLKKIKGFRVLTQNIKDSELIFVRKRDRIRVSFPAYSD